MNERVSGVSAIVSERLGDGEQLSDKRLSKCTREKGEL